MMGTDVRVYPRVLHFLSVLCNQRAPSDGAHGDGSWCCRTNSRTISALRSNRKVDFSSTAHKEATGKLARTGYNCRARGEGMGGCFMNIARGV